MNADDVVQMLTQIEENAISLIEDGWYTKDDLLEQIGEAIDAA